MLASPGAARSALLVFACLASCAAPSGDGGGGEAEGQQDEGNDWTPPHDEDEPLWPCDSYLQDCPDGEKCVPVVLDYASGQQPWNRCVPIVGDGTTGAPCTHDGLIAGTDDCDATNVCWQFDEQGEGVCHAMCTGSPDDPHCPGDQLCLMEDQGSIALCTDPCDPFAPDLEAECPGPRECLSISGGFFCDAEADLPALGEPCDWGRCGAGLTCVSSYNRPEVVPESACDELSCCVKLCALEDPEPSCSQGTTCAALDSLYPEFDYVGGCPLSEQP